MPQSPHVYVKVSGCVETTLTLKHTRRAAEVHAVLSALMSVYTALYSCVCAPRQNAMDGTKLVIRDPLLPLPPLSRDAPRLDSWMHQELSPCQGKFSLRPPKLSSDRQPVMRGRVLLPVKARS